MGEIAAKAVVQLLFATGKNFTVDGLREKLREFSGRRFARNCCGVPFERGGEILRIAAMSHGVISQPRRHFFGVRHSRLAKAE